MKLALLLLTASITLAQSVTANLADAKWTHDKGDPPGSENVFLRQDAQTGGMELLVRYPAGHVFAPHWHSVNERIVVLEGQLAVKVGSGPEKLLEAGGFAFLPAKEVQRLACTSKTRCTFYIQWDGKLDNHKAE
ncbi:MAG: Cupin 2, conserved barrel domain protein [Candidatus Solibacter sp.]|nr:Cupin 2, conserved barrel domain protein [Candidatus Solibacter sp.]